MSERPLTDARLAEALRGIVPARAPMGLYGRILDAAEAAPQQRALPAPLDRLTDADPVSRRWAILLAAALVLAGAVAGATIAGSLLGESTPAPLDVFVDRPALEPPADLPAFARSAYEAMPELGPMTIDVATDGQASGRIHVAASGAVRVERLGADGRVEGYSIYSGSSVGELRTVDGRPGWHLQAAGIAEDPRVFVYATLGAGRSSTAAGCEIAVSPGEEYAGLPARGWRWVGSETVAGRPAHHVACGTDERWIDDESRLTLRSRGVRLDAAFKPIEGSTRTVEVTSVATGQPDPALFALSPPAGATILDDTAWTCVQDPYCGAPQPPVATPRPATGEPGEPLDLEALVATAHAAPGALGPFQVALVSRAGPYPAVTMTSLSDGAGRGRMESWADGADAPQWIAIVLPDGVYTTEQTTDGVPYWQRTDTSHRRPVVYPLTLPLECDAGWRWGGVDLLLGQPADRLECGDGEPAAYWVDRQTRLVVRSHVPDPTAGTHVQEVVRLRLEAPPAALLALPPDAEVRD